MHLADAFIQSDLVHSGYTFVLSVCVFPGNRTHNLCGANAMLYPLSLMLRGSRGLMDRALDLKPEVTQGCGFKFRLWQEESTTEVRPLGKAPNPQLLPGRRNVGCPLLQVCVQLDGLNAENTFHSSLYSV